MTKALGLSLLLLASGITPLPAGASDSAPVMMRAPLEDAALAPIIAHGERELARAAKRRRAAGLALALLVDGEVRWLGSAGYADRARRTPFGADTPVPVGELSRLYLATLALALVESGQLDLDQPIAAWLPELRLRSRFENTPPITVRTLLTHHSGLPYWRLRGAYQEPERPLEALDWSEVGYLAQPTASVQVVSNLGYELLGQVLASAAGSTLDALIEARIARVLQLSRSGYVCPLDLARAHRKGEAQAPLTARERAALGVVATPDELARFAASLMPEATKSPLTPGSRAEMVRPQNAEVRFDLDASAGLGLNLARSVRPAVGRVATLIGAFPGFRTEVRYALDHGLGVVAIANSDESGEDLFDLSAETLDVLLQARSGIAPRQRDRPLPERVPWPEGLAPDTVAPLYSTPFGTVATTQRDGDFHFDAVGFGFRATRRPDSWFNVRYDLLGVIPIGFSRLNRVAIAPATLAGERVLVAFVNDRHFLAGTAARPTAAMADYARFAGEYRLVNPDVLAERLEVRVARLLYEDGLLALEYEIPAFIDLAPRVILQPIRSDVFVVPGRGANLGEEIVLDRSGSAPAILYSGYRLERISDD
jgi:CubicO group peptidase (beta-lactamase class C family)